MSKDIRLQISKAQIAKVSKVRIYKIFQSSGLNSDFFSSKMYAWKGS